MCDTSTINYIGRIAVYSDPIDLSDHIYDVLQSPGIIKEVFHDRWFCIQFPLYDNVEYIIPIEKITLLF